MLGGSVMSLLILLERSATLAVKAADGLMKNFHSGDERNRR